MIKHAAWVLNILWLLLLLTAGNVFAADASARWTSRVQSLLNTTITHHGPNCWNSALVVAGVLPQFRYTSPEEFQFLIDSPACKTIAEEDLKPGDIQVFRRTLPGLSREDIEVHANIWLTPEQAFNKKTDFSTAPYELISHAQVWEHYGRTPEIVNFTLPDTARTQVHCAADQCKNKIEYRRCGSIENLKQQDPHYSLAIEYLILSLELGLKKQLVSPARATETWKSRAERILLALDAQIQKQCGTDPGFFCTYSRNAQASLLWQIRRPQPSWLK